MPKTTRARLLLLAPLVSGCGLDVVYVDPPGIDREPSGLIIEGDPMVELGFYHEQLYEELSDGGECPIVYGLQGGTWTHPAIRIQGIAPQAVVDCQLIRLQDDELVGTAKAFSQFFVTPDAQFQVQAFPIPIVHTDPDKGPGIDDLFGSKATLQCEVADDEDRKSSASVTVTLVEG